MKPLNVADTVVDEKLWNQCKSLVAVRPIKPAVLPNRIGAMHGLEKDPDEVTVVKFVDGDFVKVQKDMNFRETTHEKCSPYADGIWVDANMPMREWPFLLYRSAHEYRSMTQDELSEDVAKKGAQKGERELRLMELKDQGKSV